MTGESNTISKELGSQMFELKKIKRKSFTSARKRARILFSKAKPTRTGLESKENALKRKQQPLVEEKEEGRGK